MRGQEQTRRTGREVQAAAQKDAIDKTRQFREELEGYAPQIQHALPPNVSINKFKQVLITAAALNPDLLYANRGTLYLAALKCASDGLLPDGRQAALVKFNTEVTRRDPQTGLDQKFRIDAVQYLPMLQGIRERMRRAGVESADAHAVYERDHFEYRLGDDAFIKHEPPPLSEKRGKVVGAYAIIKLPKGEVLRDVMSLEEIEATRNQSRAKDSLMWTRFYGEAARKTVLRRCSKAAPQAAELEQLLNRQDEPLEIPEDDDTGMHRVEAEPMRDFPALIDGDTIVDEDGVVHENPQEPATAPEAPAAAPVAPAPVQPAPEGLAQPSMAIPIPVHPRSGQSDYRAWSQGLFLPKLRQMRSTTDMSLLCGDNEAYIDEAKRNLPATDRHELEMAIGEQWDRIAELEKEPV